MKRVLVITYYWPPSGGGGVQRWLKLCKYLPEFGWKPHVYAPEGADYPLVDPTRAEDIPADLEVIRRPILEPRRLYGLFAGDQGRRSQEADEVFHRAPDERTWKQNLAVWMRGNLLIPDARVLWVMPSVKFLTSWLNEHPMDAIVTTGPPHSVHLIGHRLHQRLGVLWMADFRDPWTEIEFFGDLRLSARSDRKHRALERAVLETADSVTIVSPTWADRFKGLARNLAVITNGYDADDFAHRPVHEYDRFRLTHVGSLSLDRNPTSLWEALKQLSSTQSGFADRLEIELVGRVDPGVIQSVCQAGLEANLRIRGYLSHAEALDAMCLSSFQLLLINKDAANAPGRIPGKLFEYLAARRPILLIGEANGDAAGIVTKTGAGEVVGHDDVSRLVSILRAWYSKHESRELNEPSVASIESYSHRALARRVSEVLNKMVGAAPGHSA